MSEKKKKNDEPGYQKEFVAILYPDLVANDYQKLKESTKVEVFDFEVARGLPENKTRIHHLFSFTHNKVTVWTDASSVGQYSTSIIPGQHTTWFWVKHGSTNKLALRVTWDSILMYHVNDQNNLVVNGLEPLSAKQ
jgi:hypothetical protein